MKRVWICLLSVFLLAVLMSGCGKDTAAFEKNDITVTVAGTEIRTDLPVEEILDILGAAYGEYSCAEAVSCVYEGMDKTFGFDGATLYTYPDGSSDRLMELYFENGDVQTGKGIGVGAEKTDVIECYGAGVESGSVLSYELSASSPENLPASLYFLIKNDRVTAIAITAEHRAE